MSGKCADQMPTSSSNSFKDAGAIEGEKVDCSVELRGRVHEYLINHFASAKSKNGEQHYTPSRTVCGLFEMLAPHRSCIRYLAYGSGGKLGDISIYGQESNATTRRLAIMNLAIRGIEADFGPEHADTFRRDLHLDLRADYVLANPPFNDSDRVFKNDDVRRKAGALSKRAVGFRLGP